MVKKKPHSSLRGKKPVNAAKSAKKTPVSRNPSHITNRLKRSEMYGKYLQQKRQEKKQSRIQRVKEAEALGDDKNGIKKAVPRTLDNTREVEPTMVLQDPEVAADEAEDEFARYFHSETPPKVLVTTRPRPSQRLFFFIADLQRLIPKLHFYPRKSFSLKEICQFAANREFTHVMVLSENAKHCNGMTISHIGAGGEMLGPTAYFKVSNVVTSQNIPNHGASTNHIPELNLHGFGTRLGHRVGRLLGSLFPHDAEFQGRQVVTFHNQRDYLFVRHHRYVFEEKKNIKKAPPKGTTPEASQDEQQPLGIKDRVKARLQELGPRFTLKLRWIQSGTFDTQFGEYEWMHKRKEMDTTRRRFHL
ncbi:anticodon-binding protein [Nitzschia inconspicua]|uniref:Anticodon-binding protein n=1 Tax=Nitzschia inconspicua TaxID=303405 RepID=A0A9K3PVW0_9STRA|nr:anticodon-binding protein [Nitzschia inconspicua]